MGAWTQKLIIRLKVGFSITFIYEFNIDLYALVLNKSKDFFGEQFRTYPEHDSPTASCTMTFSNVGVINILIYTHSNVPHVKTTRQSIIYD